MVVVGCVDVFVGVDDGVEAFLGFVDFNFYAHLVSPVIFGKIAVEGNKAVVFLFLWFFIWVSLRGGLNN